MAEVYSSVATVVLTTCDPGLSVTGEPVRDMFICQVSHVEVVVLECGWVIVIFWLELFVCIIYYFF